MVTQMTVEKRGPQSTRAKVVHFIWKNIPRVVLLGLIVLFFVLGKVIGTKKELMAEEKAAAVAQERPLVNTVTLALEPTTISDRINLPGGIEPWTKLNLAAKVGGSITEVLVQEGDKVQEGDVIARIEANDYRIALDRAKAAHKLAKADFARDKKVHAKGVIPTAELEAKETMMQTAKADMENAELLLSRCTITAPMSGVVSRLDAEVGLFLAVGDPIGELLKIDMVKAVVGIPESDITSVRKLEEVDITIKALGSKVVTGKKFFLSPSADSAARSYRLELAIDNSDGDLLPGMFIRANIVKNEFHDAVAIPFYSVISRNDEQYVFVEKDGVVDKRNVELGIMEKWMVQITEGLSPGENVVIEGHRDVEAEQKVKVVKSITNPGDYAL